MKLDKNYKVRVTPEQSRQIQELVFKLGGNLQSGDTSVKETHLERLYVGKCLKMSFGLTEHGWSYQEGATIQADDLIALLTDLSKSAENPLQDMKLTPGFEAVEPKFNAGDKVYIPNIKNLCTIRDDGKVITSNGQYYCDLSDSYDLCFVLATPENHALLSKLYPHIEFEQPPKELKGSDLARALIKKGWVGFNCVCGNSGDDNVLIHTVITGKNHSGKFISIDGRLFNNAVPMLGSFPLTAQEAGL